MLARIESEGPLTGGVTPGEAPRKTGWWNWSNGKIALEYLFWAGRITTATRRGFERVYDLTERVIPAAILNQPTPSEDEAHRALLMIAAKAMGIGTAADLADYFRLPLTETKARVEAMAEDGLLTRLRVQGWRNDAYLWPDARAPRKLAANALLSPFDNLIWRRERTERLFDARIRIEIYTPSAKRQHGYYVLFFLQGEAITARVDLKADRAAEVLRVQAAHLEPGADEGTVVPALADELRVMAGWLDLDEVVVTQRGDLAAALTSALP